MCFTPPAALESKNQDSHIQDIEASCAAFSGRGGVVRRFPGPRPKTKAVTVTVA